MDLLGHPSIASLRLKSLWDEYEARETAESKFVKDLDLYELCVQAVEYENSAYFTVAYAPVEAGAIQLTGPLMDQVKEQRTCKSSSRRLCRGSSTRSWSDGLSSCT